jgi:hypothetical protein
MHSELLERFRIARNNIVVPTFPLSSIRLAAQSAPHHRARGPIAAAIAVSLFAAGIAAATVMLQTHITFTPSGGMLIKSDAKSGSRPIHSEAEVREAARHLNFPAILPAGLPEGTEPIRLFTSGSDLIAVTYNLPGAQRRSHHLLWIFLANPAAMSPWKAPRAAYQLRTGRMTQAHWRAGSEEVIVVSNGLTPQELAAIKRAMIR